MLTGRGAWNAGFEEVKVALSEYITMRCLAFVNALLTFIMNPAVFEENHFHGVNGAYKYALAINIKVRNNIALLTEIEFLANTTELEVNSWVSLLLTPHSVMFPRKLL